MIKIQSDSEVRENLKTVSKTGLTGRPAFETCLDNQPVDLTQFQIPTGIKHWILCGIGGSSLGFETIYNFIPTLRGRCTILDTIEPQTINEICEQTAQNPEDYGFIIISKSGKTPETVSVFFTLFESLKSKTDKNQWVFVSDEGSPLHQLAVKNNAPFFPIPADLGGRFSVLSTVGQVPMKCLGLDTAEFLRGATDMRALSKSDKFDTNIPYQCAAHQFQALQDGLAVQVLWSYREKWGPLTYWWQQLMAESTGKSESGILPFSANGVRHQHSLLQYFVEGGVKPFFLYLWSPINHDLHLPTVTEPGFEYLSQKSLGKLLEAEFHGVQQSLKQVGREGLTIEVEKMDLYHLGALFYLFESATYFLGELMGVDVFDQPGVEASKIIARKAFD